MVRLSSAVVLPLLWSVNEGKRVTDYGEDSVLEHDEGAHFEDNVGQSRFSDRRRRSTSHFRVGEDWDSKTFAEQWEEYSHAVPLERFQGGENPGWIPDGTQDGMSCAPYLWGPEDANNLLIMVHGFMACPGRWGLTIKDIMSREVTCGLPGGEGADAPRPCGKYRIMGVTLPGHGYKWEEIETKVKVLHQSNSTSSSQSVNSHRRDNITDIPFDKFAWMDFTEAVGRMAEQWRKEHPDGVIAIDGHSVGGLMSLAISVRRAHIFDRVLIQNPELGPNNVLFNPAERVSKHLRLNIDALSDDCEGERDEGMAFPGGQCQFKFGHIGSAWSFARDLYCRQWQISRCATTGWVFNTAAYEDARRNFTKIKAFQMVQTKGDTAVEEKRILMFMQEFNDARPDDPHVGLCTFPKVMTHTYLVPNYINNHPGGERWWAPMALDRLNTFLLEGKTIPISEKEGNFNWKSTSRKSWLIASISRSHQRGDYCIPKSKTRVSGKYLTVLPAQQSKTEYEIARPDGSVARAKVLFQGLASKESETAGVMYERVEELLEVDDYYVFVGRKNVDALISELYLVGTVIREKDCLASVVAKLNPLEPLFLEIENGMPSLALARPWKLEFCNADFVSVVCSELDCTADVQ